MRIQALGLTFMSLLLAAGMTACSGSSDFGAAGIGAKKSAAKDTEEDDSDDDEEKSDVPAEVSGAFLTCAFMESESDVLNTVKSSPEAEVEIGCGFYRYSWADRKNAKILLGRLDVNGMLLTNELGLDSVNWKRLPMGSPFHALFSIPVRYLAGTVHLEVVHSTIKPTAHRRSIPTISVFNAKYGFKVENDVQALGTTLDPETGNMVTGSGDSGEISGPTTTEMTTSSPKWWQVAALYIAESFGEQAAQPASNDVGTTPMQPVTQVSQSAQSGSGGQQQSSGGQMSGGGSGKPGSGSGSSSGSGSGASAGTGSGTGAGSGSGAGSGISVPGPTPDGKKEDPYQPVKQGDNSPATQEQQTGGQTTVEPPPTTDAGGEGGPTTTPTPLGGESGGSSGETGGGGTTPAAESGGGSTTPTAGDSGGSGGG